MINILCKQKVKCQRIKRFSKGAWNSKLTRGEFMARVTVLRFLLVKKKIGVNQDRTCALSWQWPFKQPENSHKLKQLHSLNVIKHWSLKMITTSYETREPNSLTAAAKFGVLANFLRGFPIAASFSLTITSCKLDTDPHLAGSKMNELKSEANSSTYWSS